MNPWIAFFLAPDQFWLDHFPKFSRGTRWLFPFVVFSLCALIWSVIQSLLQTHHNVNLMVQHGLRTFTLLWFALTTGAIFLTGTLVLVLYFLDLKPAQGNWWTIWGECFWAILPLFLIVLPFGVFGAWIGLITTGAWVYVRFRPRWMDWVRLGVVWGVLTAGSAIGFVSILHIFVHTAQLMILRRLLSG